MDKPEPITFDKKFEKTPDGNYIYAKQVVEEMRDEVKKCLTTDTRLEYVDIPHSTRFPSL